MCLKNRIDYFDITQSVNQATQMSCKNRCQLKNSKLGKKWQILSKVARCYSININI